MRSLPSERRAKGPGEWNHYRITANNGTLKLAVNGKEVSGGYDISPRKGYIALESEGAPTLFRNIRIRELPSARHARRRRRWRRPTKATRRCTTARASPAGMCRPTRRRAGAQRLDDRLRGDAPAPGKPLLSADIYGDVEVIADWRWVDEEEPAASQTAAAVVSARMLPGVAHGGDAAGRRAAQAAGKWNRVVQRIVGNRLTMTVNGKVVVADAAQDGLPAEGPHRARAGRAQGGVRRTSS